MVMMMKELIRGEETSNEKGEMKKREKRWKQRGGVVFLNSLLAQLLLMFLSKVVSFR